MYAIYCLRRWFVYKSCFTFLNGILNIESSNVFKWQKQFSRNNLITVYTIHKSSKASGVTNKLTSYV